MKFQSLLWHVWHVTFFHYIFFNLIFRESSDDDEEIAEAMAEINKFEEKLKQREAINQEKF